MFIFNCNFDILSINDNYALKACFRSHSLIKVLIFNKYFVSGLLK